MRAEIQIKIQDALNSMDPIDREILALRHFEELTNSETAAVLEIHKAAASNRYVRALRRLKEILAPMLGLGDGPGGLAANSVNSSRAEHDHEQRTARTAIPSSVLAEEFAARLRRGEHPSLKEFIDRYPEHADDIRELFPCWLSSNSSSRPRRTMNRHW